jgi:hypothetical protein
LFQRGIFPYSLWKKLEWKVELSVPYSTKRRKILQDPKVYDSVILLESTIERYLNISEA